MNKLGKSMLCCGLLAICCFGFASGAFANEEAIAANSRAVDLVWMLVAAFLVFFMQPGFAMVEAGFTRAKNAVNIMMKNLMDFSIGSLGFFMIGFGLMFGKDAAGFFLSGVDPTSPEGSWRIGFYMFQVVFAATAATIVSGAMAERTKFTAYLVYSVFISALIYPISGSWAWGSLLGGEAGWLENLGFTDFAGSTVVHSVGGWAGLVGAFFLGPRDGKYTTVNGRKQTNAIPGHNIPLAALGVFILWFGWFGFNAGSTTAGTDVSIAVISVTTALAASAGAIAAMLTVWAMFGKPDGSMALNGVLAGLVAITAGCANVSPLSAVMIGAIAGIVVVLSVEFIDKVLHIDDPVGAVSVHGTCGALGTLLVGLFAQPEFGGSAGVFFGGGVGLLKAQLIGVVAVFAWTVITSAVLFGLTKALVGLRVTTAEERRGLDIGEHGMEAYAGFQIFSTQ
jgi:ammonium transporter, Amt family